VAIKTLCNYNVATVLPSASISEVAGVMRESHVGDVVVVEHKSGKNVPVGIVTDRDLVIEVLAEGVDPSQLKVADIMSTNLVTLHEDSGIEFAVHEMGRAGVRRLPVLDSAGEVVGVLSGDDVVAYVAELAKDFAEALDTGQFQERRRRP
jgi:CBS domain-containing protein